MTNANTLIIREAEYLRRLPDNLGGVNSTGGQRRRKSSKAHMVDFASTMYTPEIAEEDERVRIGRLRTRQGFVRLDDVSSDREEYTRAVYPKLPKGVTLSEALEALLIHRPGMLREVYSRACERKHVGVLMTLGGIVKGLVARGIYSVPAAKERGDYRFFRQVAKSCPTGTMIFAAIAGN